MSNEAVMMSLAQKLRVFLVATDAEIDFLVRDGIGATVDTPMIADPGASSVPPIEDIMTSDIAAGPGGVPNTPGQGGTNASLAGGDAASFGLLNNTPFPGNAALSAFSGTAHELRYWNAVNPPL